MDRSFAFIRLVVLGRMVRITGKPLEIAVAFYNSVNKINREKIAFGIYGGEGLSVSSPHFRSPQRLRGPREIIFCLSRKNFGTKKYTDLIMFF